MIFARFSVCVALCLMGGISVTARDVFVPERGAIIPDTWETDAMGGLFQNPAQLLTGLGRTTIRVDGSQDGLGYSQASVGTRFSLDGIAFGLGYSTYGSQDLVRTSRNDQTQRIEENGNFGDSIQQMVVAAAMPINSKLQLGVNMDWITHSIDTSTASQVGVGVGARYRVLDELWLSAYSRRLLQTQFQWGDVSESSPMSYAVGAEYRTAHASVVSYVSDRAFRVSGELPVTVEFSLTGGYVGGDVERYSVGTILKLGEYAVQYVHTGYSDSTLGLSQDMIGVAININDFTK